MRLAWFSLRRGLYLRACRCDTGGVVAFPRVEGQTVDGPVLPTDSSALGRIDSGVERAATLAKRAVAAVDPKKNRETMSNRGTTDDARFCHPWTTLRCHRGRPAERRVAPDLCR